LANKGVGYSVGVAKAVSVKVSSSPMYIYIINSDHILGVTLPIAL